MFVYIHVPFCQSRCIYCDFYVELEKYGGQDAFVDGLLKEIDLLWTSPAEALAPIKGLYVGGGTPSLLSASDYEKIFNHIEVYTSFEPNAEITLEANPLGMKDSPKAYLNTGFNRISLGVQSFNDIELKKLSRIHTMNDAIKSVKQLERAGFKSISIDLMYGTPLQTLQSWKETLRYAVGLEPQHISLYGLKVEDKTPLEALVNKGFYAVADDDLHIDMYDYAIQFLTENGLYQYEFSNFSRPGFESKHNLNYWNNESFWAFGPSAHGYINQVRYENPANLKQWIESPLSGKRHPCSPQEQLENALIFGLRKTKGVDIDALEQQYKFSFLDKYGYILTKYANDNYFKFNKNNLTLTKKAIKLSNIILSEFIEV